MILGTFRIRHCAEAHGADRILMAARDCNLWHGMLSSRHFARLRLPASAYVSISRAVCYEESVEYEAYLQSMLGSRSLLVDFVGTGKSLRTIIERMGRRDAVTPCILAGEPQTIDPQQSFSEALILKEFFAYRLYLEALNASLDGSTAVVVRDDFRLKVLDRDNEFSDPVRAIIGQMRGAFSRFLTNLDRFDVPEALPPARRPQDRRRRHRRASARSGGKAVDAVAGAEAQPRPWQRAACDDGLTIVSPGRMENRVRL